jgi:thioredoxin 1
MLRRSFTIGLLAVLTQINLPVPTGSANEGMIDYSVGDIKKALTNDETVFVDYSAEWCGTCKRQKRIIEKLRSQNPEYNAAITFVTVDWDLFRSDEVTTSRNIPRRSTLIVLKGDKELGRIVAGTSESDIRELMDIGLGKNM